MDDERRLRGVKGRFWRTASLRTGGDDGWKNVEWRSCEGGLWGWVLCGVWSVRGGLEGGEAGAGVDRVGLESVGAGRAARGAFEGRNARRARGQAGFSYGPLLVFSNPSDPLLGKPAAELTPEE